MNTWRGQTSAKAAPVHRESELDPDDFQNLLGIYFLVQRYISAKISMKIRSFLQRCEPKLLNIILHCRRILLLGPDPDADDI